MHAKKHISFTRKKRNCCILAIQSWMKSNNTWNKLAKYLDDSIQQHIWRISSTYVNRKGVSANFSYMSPLKPIFHCDAKPFALGPGNGLDPQRHSFMLGIPTCWYLKTLKFALPNAKPQRESVEYRVPNIKFSHWPCTFFWCRFHSRWVPFFSGIWALECKLWYCFPCTKGNRSPQGHTRHPNGPEQWADQARHSKPN